MSAPHGYKPLKARRGRGRLQRPSSAGWALEPLAEFVDLSHARQLQLLGWPPAELRR